ncbi:hypothetical protein Syun_016098 [Stephania yunnanensis]|uniref:Nodulin-like domain-containing protein n=1 Tax=Stephania yunnanensis TaxID=152371 RepID=A0AAP0P4J4_9MAGN
MGMPSSFKVHLLSWLTLVGIILLQSISNTNSNFSIYSSQLKQLLSISNLQVHNLFIASEVGKLFGCIPTAASNHLPIWTLLIIGVGMGLVSYGVQFLYMVNQISSLSYWHLLPLQFLAGNSMSWINTACNVAAMRSFPAESRMIITLTSAYSGFSAKIYTSMVEGVHGKGARNASTYLLLSSLVPIAFGLAFLILVRDFSSKQLLIPLFHDAKRAARTSFLIVVFLVVSVTEGYSLVDSVVPAFRVVPPLLRLAILLVLMITLPLGVPLVMVLRQAIVLKPNELPPSITPHDMLPNNIDHAEESSIECSQDQNHTNPDGGVKEQSVISVEPLKTRDDVNTIIHEGDHDEHRVVDLLLNLDFWLLFWGCACGATLSNVYFNNLECISKYSHSYGNSETRFLLAISSAYGFYGRLFTGEVHIEALDDGDPDDTNDYVILLDSQL